MNILVFIKQVADAEATVSISSEKMLDMENKFVINFFDEFAIEEALGIKEAVSGSQVTVCTFGPQRAIEALRTAIAMGADNAVLIDGSAMAYDNPLTISQVLASFALKNGFDVILCGRQAIDDENAIIGTMVAELLKIPHVSRITKLDILGNTRVKVESDIEGGKGLFEVVLPALFTTQKGLNEPRVPLITGVMKAMRTEISVIDPEQLGFSKEVLSGNSDLIISSYELPPKRQPVKIIEGASPGEKVKELIRLLREEAKVF